LSNQSDPIVNCVAHLRKPHEFPEATQGGRMRDVAVELQECESRRRDATCGQSFCSRWEPLVVSVTKRGAERYETKGRNIAAM